MKFCSTFIFLFLILLFLSPNCFSQAIKSQDLLGCDYPPMEVGIKIQAEISLPEEELRYLFGIFHFGLRSEKESYSLIWNTLRLKSLKKNNNHALYEALLRADYCGPPKENTVLEVPIPAGAEFLKSLLKTPSNFSCVEESEGAVDEKNLWYFWNPLKKNDEACSKITKNFKKLKMELKFESKKLPTYPVQDHALKEVGIILGSITGKISAEVMHEKMKKITDEFKKNKKILIFKEEFELSSLTHFLFHLNERYPLKKLILREDFLLEMETQINQEKVHLRLYYGPTEISKENQVYVKNLFHFLESSDLIIYIGHSFFGENLNFSEIQTVLNLSNAEFQKRMSQKKHQVWGINSCFAASYVEEHLLKTRPELSTELFLSMSSTYLPNFPLFMIERLVDKRNKGFFPKEWQNKFKLKRIHYE